MTNRKTNDDSEDPIAQSLAIRVKHGGITTVVSAADVKKSGGLIKTTTTTTTPAITKPTETKDTQ